MFPLVEWTELQEVYNDYNNIIYKISNMHNNKNLKIEIGYKTAQSLRVDCNCRLVSGSRSKIISMHGC